MRKRHSNRGLRKVCGCARRQWPKCSHTWHLNFRFKGTHYRLSLDRELDRHIAGKTAAASEAEKIRTAIREGTFRQRDANPAQPIPAREALTLAAFAKTNPSIEFVGAITAQGKFISAEEVKALATLPSKENLIAQVIATLQSPLNDTVSGLSGNLHALLDGIEAKASN